jgi:hypothetical protein
VREPDVRGEQRIRPLAGEVGRRARDRDDDRVHRLGECGRPALERTEQSLDVRDGRRPRVGRRRGQLHPQRAQELCAGRAGQGGEDAAQRRADYPVERRLVVRVSLDGGIEPRMVQRQRDADQSGPLGQQALELERQPPAGRAPCLEERVGVCGAKRVDAGRRDQCRGATVEEGLRGRDRDDQIGLDEVRVDA